MSRRTRASGGRSFPSGTGVTGNGTVTDTTTGTVVGGVGACSPTELCGTFYGGVTINPGDSLSVDATSQTLPPPAAATPSRSTPPRTPRPTTSSNSFRRWPGPGRLQRVGGRRRADRRRPVRSPSSPSASGRSSTGGMSQADSGEWWAQLPLGHRGDGQRHRDRHHHRHGGGRGRRLLSRPSSAAPSSAGSPSTPEITPSVDAGLQAPAAGSGYTISVHTSSDTTPTTSSNSFKTVAAQVVSAPQVSLSATTPGRRVTYSVTFKTSSTGALWQSDAASGTCHSPPAARRQRRHGHRHHHGTVVGGVGTCGSSTRAAPSMVG